MWRSSADERSRAIRLQVLPGELKVHSSSPKPEKVKKRIPAEYGGPQTDIGFNAQYMLDFLARCQRRRMCRSTSAMRRAPARCGLPAETATDSTGT